jgi:hypothetical protein
MVNQLRGQALRFGHANYTTPEEIPTGEEVLAGMFFLNESPINTLFDSGASCDFMSSTCAKKAKLSLVASGVPYIIFTLEGWVYADWIVQKVSLELNGSIFSTNLTILSGQGIHVILGMSWTKMHNAVLDIASQQVHLNSPVYGKVTLHLPVISHIKASLHHMVEKKTEEVHVVQEFLDVFLDDLLRMPPERVIEFNIELQPGIAPIAKSLYWMMPMELVEPKIQLKDLLYPPKFITLVLSNIICEEERWGSSSMCGLPTAKCHNHQEKVSTAMYWLIV